MRKRKIICIICLLVCILLVGVGCRAPARPTPQPTPQIDRDAPDRELNDRNEDIDDQGRNVNDRDRNVGEDAEDAGDGDFARRTEKIKNEVEKLKDVKSASVVISENTALVGVNLTEDTKAELNTDIKNDIEDAVKKADREIDRVSITADPDLLSRIENIGKEIGRGRPLSGFGREIEEIVRRVTPDS
ncbi:MAG: YhcN/YlaJ family sporulation lipoprotein [Alkaliphilus sp.]